MAIIMKTVFCGEGISSSGVSGFEEALADHTRTLVIGRLTDLMGKGEKWEASQIARNFDAIEAAVKSGMNQAYRDNEDLIRDMLSHEKITELRAKYLRV